MLGERLVTNRAPPSSLPQKKKRGPPSTADSDVWLRRNSFDPAATPSVLRHPHFLDGPGRVPNAVRANPHLMNRLNSPNRSLHNSILDLDANIDAIEEEDKDHHHLLQPQAGPSNPARSEPDSDSDDRDSDGRDSDPETVSLLSRTRADHKVIEDDDYDANV